jgi:hypothetical protein
MFAFAGPAYLVSVGYMDPGNWATDLEGGARFGYRLLWVLLNGPGNLRRGNNHAQMREQGDCPDHSTPRMRRLSSHSSPGQVLRSLRDAGYPAMAHRNDPKFQ